MQSKNAIGNLINRYKAVLKKCHLLNTFGSLAVAGMLAFGLGALAMPQEVMAAATTAGASYIIEVEDPAKTYFKGNTD